MKICSPSWRLDLCCKYLTGKTHEQLIKFLSAKTTSVIYGEIWGGRSSWQQPQVVTWLGILTHHFRLDSQGPQAHREQTEPRAQHVKTLTDLGDSEAHPLILCACQEKGVKISWGAGMAHELLSLSLHYLHSSTDNPTWHVGLDGTEVCWHPRNGDLSILYKANQYEVFPKTKHASDYQMMYSCLQYR